MSEWIKLSDRLPEIDQEVITYSPSGFIAVALYCEEQSSGRREFIVPYPTDELSEKNVAIYVIDVSHWMPLPLPVEKNFKESAERTIKQLSSALKSLADR